MKHLLTFIIAALLLAACGDTEEKLRERAEELCANHI